MREDIFTNKEAADYIGVKENTLAIWRSTGRYKIPYVKVGTKVIYNKVDLDAWLDSRRYEVA